MISVRMPVRVSHHRSGSKARVAFGLNRDTRRTAFHVSIEHPAYSSGVISGGHEHDGPECLLVAPWRKNLAFTFGSSFVSVGIFTTSVTPSHPSCRICLAAEILVGQPPANELEIFPARRVGKNRNPRRDAAMHEVGRLQRPGAAGISAR